jgi:hypothetical protein
VYENKIYDHKTIGTAIASYHITELEWSDANYDPFTYSVRLSNNDYKRRKSLPDMSKDFGKMVNLLFPGKPQDILYDGIIDDKRSGSNPMQVCILEKGEGLRFANIDAAHDFKTIDTDLKNYACQ